MTDRNSIQSHEDKRIQYRGYTFADIDRIERLFAVMTVAFTWAYLVGIYKDANIKPIRILKNGRRAKSFFKYGLEEIEETLSNLFKKEKFSIFKILSCT